MPGIGDPSVFTKLGFGVYDGTAVPADVVESEGILGAVVDNGVGDYSIALSEAVDPDRTVALANTQEGAADSGFVDCEVLANSIRVRITDGGALAKDARFGLALFRF